MTISDEAVEAAARALAGARHGLWELTPSPKRRLYMRDARLSLEAAAPILLSHEREETRLAHLDAMVNRETKRAELAQAWDEGESAGWLNNASEQEPSIPLQKNPYRSQT